MKQPRPNPDPKRLAEQIDDNLKRVYQATLDEAVPDRFAALLAQLKADGDAR